MKKKLLVLFSLLCITISNLSLVYAGSGVYGDPWTRAEAIQSGITQYADGSNYYINASELSKAKSRAQSDEISKAAGGAIGNIKNDINNELEGYKTIMNRMKPNAGNVLGLFGDNFWNILSVVMSIVAVLLFVVFAVIMFYNFYMVITPGLYFEGGGGEGETKGMRRFISKNTKDCINEGASWGKWLKGETKRIIMFIIIEALLAGGLITLISFIMNLVNITGINSAVGG